MQCIQGHNFHFWRRSGRRSHNTGRGSLLMFQFDIGMRAGQPRIFSCIHPTALPLLLLPLLQCCRHCRCCHTALHCTALPLHFTALLLHCTAQYCNLESSQESGGYCVHTRKKVCQTVPMSANNEGVILASSLPCTLWKSPPKKQPTLTASDCH